MWQFYLKTGRDNYLNRSYKRVSSNLFSGFTGPSGIFTWRLHLATGRDDRVAITVYLRTLSLALPGIVESLRGGFI